MYEIILDMNSLLINIEDNNYKLISELTQKLGGKVIKLSSSQYEDFVLGSIMQKEKTGKNVSKSTILKKIIT